MHIPKVAGQSIESALRASVTGPASNDEFLLRKRRSGEQGPERLAHLSASEYTECGYVSPEQFAASFKFSFVRHPADRAWSLFRHFGFDVCMSFEYFLEKLLKGELWQERHWFVRPQCDFVLDDDGKLLVDFLGRFESLEADFERVAAALDLPSSELPHVNRPSSGTGAKFFRAVRRYPPVLTHWRGLVGARSARDTSGYSDDALGMINELYACDYEQFGYENQPGAGEE